MKSAFLGHQLDPMDISHLHRMQAVCLPLGAEAKKMLTSNEQLVHRCKKVGNIWQPKKDSPMVAVVVPHQQRLRLILI